MIDPLVLGGLNFLANRQAHLQLIPDRPQMTQISRKNADSL